MSDTQTETLLAAISGSANSEAIVRHAKLLADRLEIAWEAVHIEVPSARSQRLDSAAADALGLAARLGATIATLPAATAADGIEGHLRGNTARHLVLGMRQATRWQRFCRQTLAERLASNQDMILHLVPGSASPASLLRERLVDAISPSPGRHYLLSASLVLATLLIAAALQPLLGARPLDLLFLYPVIAVAARFGLRPALLAVVLSVVSYNYFLLLPAFSFNPVAPQNLVMSGVLLAVAIYTGVLTKRMRGRVLLSDRSARENASVAALAQKLTRDADWGTTAKTICEHVHGLLELNTMVLREVEGKLVIAAALPTSAALGPVDQAALDWAWSNGHEAGSGTGIVSAADWQFQPLKTSLGVLAMLGVARDDGRDPVRADQRILLLTLVAQAALAHERLRLEDVMRANAARS